MINQRPKVSFCTTCKGREHYLKQTLPKNLKNNPNAEFVILDYDSGELETWMKENYQAEMKSGRIRYGKFSPAPYFRIAHAKNMAHRLATGDVVCNLDAEAFLKPGLDDWLSKNFAKNPDIYVRMQKNGRKLAGMLRHLEGVHDHGLSDLAGMVALSRRNFMRLNGYDERMEGWAGDDTYLVERAEAMGLSCIPIPVMMIDRSLTHDTEERLRNFSPEVRKKPKNFWRIMMRLKCPMPSRCARERSVSPVLPIHRRLIRTASDAESSRSILKKK